MFRIGITPPFYRDPVEYTAFNLWAMDESRKDELRDLAKQLHDSTYNTYATQYLTQSEVDFVMNECRRLRELD